MIVWRKGCILALVAMTAHAGESRQKLHSSNRLRLECIMLGATW